MGSEYGDWCKHLREERKQLRMRFGKNCPVCLRERPKGNPSILLPGQTCRVDGYRDQRTEWEDEHA